MLKRNQHIFIAVVLFLGITFNHTYAQGCSDAGVCTLPELTGSSNHLSLEHEQLKDRTSFGVSIGLGEQDVLVTTPYLVYDRMIASRFSISTKATFASSDGDLGTYSGPGDLFFTGTYLLYKDQTKSLSFTGGIKIPLDDASGEGEGQSLPMVYQSSLGTYDLILGASYATGKMRFSAGFQQPLTGANKNSFNRFTYPDVSANEFPTTTDFERKGDLLVRFTYDIPVTKGNLIIRPSLLPIYHLGNDTYTDINGNEQELDVSRGLTLNWNLDVEWNVSASGTLRLILGSPIITRDIRPDGLTRSLVAGLEYGISF